MPKLSILRQAGRVEVALTGERAEIAGFLAQLDPEAAEQCIDRGLQFPLELGRILSLEPPVQLADGTTRLVLWSDRASSVESECEPLVLSHL